MFHHKRSAHVMLSDKKRRRDDQRSWRSRNRSPSLFCLSAECRSAAAFIVRCLGKFALPVQIFFFLDSDSWILKFKTWTNLNLKLWNICQKADMNMQLYQNPEPWWAHSSLFLIVYFLWFFFEKHSSKLALLSPLVSRSNKPSEMETDLHLPSLFLCATWAV